MWRNDQFEIVKELLEEIRNLLLIEVVELAPVPTKISITWSGQEKGAAMADVVLTGAQSTTATITLLDANSNPVSGAAIDAGTLFASFADGSNLSITAGADTTSFTVTSTGTAVAGDVLTVQGSFNGVALIPATATFDVVSATPDVPTQISVAFSAPVSA